MRLKQSTAVAISFGPFVSQSDGVTLNTGLVSAIDNGSTGVKLSKNGGALTIRHASVTASTYDGYGNYIVTLDTTDVNTLGTLRMQFADATTNLVVFQDFEVVNANEWDSSFGTSVYKFSDAKQWLTGTIPAVTVTGVPKVDAAYLLGTAWLAPGVAGTPDVNAKLAGNTAWGSGAITAGAVAASALNGKGDWLLSSSYTAPSNLTTAQIATGVWQDATAGDFTTAGSIGKDLKTGAVPGAASGILIAGSNAATTFATLTSTGALTISGVSNISQTGDSFAVVKSGGTGDNAAIKAKTDNLPALPASTTNISAGTITTVTTTTTATNLTNAPTNGDLTAAMKASVTAAVPTAATIAQAVWDALTSALTMVGSIGKKLADWTIGTAQTGDGYAIVNSGTFGNSALKTLIDAIQADLPTRITKNAALANFPFFMVKSSDHATGQTGLTVTATRSLDGAAFSSCANSVTEIGGGWYKISLAATDTNANTIAFNFDGGATADVLAFTVATQPD